MFLKFKTRANAVVTQLRGLRGRWRHASSKATVHNIAHPATTPPSVDSIICLQLLIG